MTARVPRGSASTGHRIDVPCKRTGFSTPPFEVDIKFIRSRASTKWTLVAYAASGESGQFAHWLGGQPGIGPIPPSAIYPNLLLSRTSKPPPEWAMTASFAWIQHLRLAPDGASWFIDGTPERVRAFERRLARGPSKPRI